MTEPALRSAFAVRCRDSEAQKVAYTACPAARLPGAFAAYGGAVTPASSFGLAPALADAVNDRVDLLVGQHAAFLLREGRHRGSGTALGDGRCAACRRRRSPDTPDRTDAMAGPLLAVGTMAAGAVLAVEHDWIEDRIRVEAPRAGRRLSAQRVQPASCDQRQQQSNQQMRSARFIAAYPRRRARA